jgi:tetratricopeptide (TPR) repeat protein
MAYDRRGLAHWYQGNLEAALADYNSALALNARLPDPWYHRGLIKAKRKDWAGAIADYDETLKLNPRQTTAYSERGQAKFSAGNFDGAMADQTTALEADPKYANAWRRRAVMKIYLGDLEGASADCERTIQIDPRFGRAYLDRADVECLRRDWSRALQDFRRWHDLSTGDQGLARLSIWVMRARAGDRTGADQELSSWLDAQSMEKAARWEAKQASFLVGRISEEEFLANLGSAEANGGAEDRCRALYFVGMKKLLDGDKSGAAEGFRKCLATGEKTRMSYLYAQAELKVLGEKDGE